MVVEPDGLYRMRKPCTQCGCVDGYISERNGQACVFCDGCGRYQYNAPKHERGLAPKPLRVDGVSLSARYRVMEAASFRCELCGASGDTETLHIGHLVSVKEASTHGIPSEWVDDEDNLACLCDRCNLGMGKNSMPLHTLLVFLMRRAMARRVTNA